MACSIVLRPSSSSAAEQPSDFHSPSIAWLKGTWHVTHSTLPMWKTKRNVKITYTPLEPSRPTISSEETDRLDDLVSYQTVDSDKVSTIRGIDTAALTTPPDTARHTWDWRGKGWLRLITSHWEVIGWGEEQESGNKWAVTFFAKTWFTPEGIDVYSQHNGGLSPQTLRDIKEALLKVDDPTVQRLAAQLFEVKMD